MPTKDGEQSVGDMLRNVKDKIASVLPANPLGKASKPGWPRKPPTVERIVAHNPDISVNIHGLNADVVNEIQTLRNIKIRQGLIDNINVLSARFDREATRIIQLPSTPNTVSTQRSASQYAKTISANLKNLADTAQISNDKVDKVIAQMRTSGRTVAQVVKGDETSEEVAVKEKVPSLDIHIN